MSEPIEMPFGMVTWVGPRNHVIHGGPDPPREGAILMVSGPLKTIVKHMILGLGKGAICVKASDLCKNDLTDQDAVFFGGGRLA